MFVVCLKAIVLYEAEKLSIESLLYIKWLLEKYEGCNKVFFCCSDESKLQPVKPLCITIRLSSPSTQEVPSHPAFSIHITHNMLLITFSLNS